MKYISTKFEDNLLIVTITRPDEFNALNEETLAELKQVFLMQASTLNGLKLVVITEPGKNHLSQEQTWESWHTLAHEHAVRIGGVGLSLPM